MPLLATAGVVLVVGLMLLNFAVLVGTINGVIFYANILRANHAVAKYPTLSSAFS